MHTLLVSGDSWTSCWPLEEDLGHRDHGWPSLVANALDFVLIDKSRAGTSNYRIYRKAVEGILDPTVDTVIVFLTSWTRFETGSTYGDKPGQIYQHQPGIDADIFEKFFNGYKNYTDSLRMIISLQALASVHNTDCWFLDTFSKNIYKDITISDFKKILKLNPKEFDNIDDDRIRDKFKKVKVLESAVDWTSFISDQSYQQIIHNCRLVKGHPVEDGHLRIAQVVIDFLREVNNGKTI